MKLERHDEAIVAARLGIARGLGREPPAPAVPIKLLWVLAQSHRARGHSCHSRHSRSPLARNDLATLR